MPKENSVLNYRLAGFSVPPNKAAATYLFQIARGSFSDEKDFSDNIVISKEAGKNRTVILLPSFGAAYTWRVCFLDSKNKKSTQSPLYHFNTGMSESADTTKHGMHIVKHAAGEHKNMLLLFDYVFAMYDMNGAPLWYVPKLLSGIKPGTEMRDLKPTADGTFTALCGTDAVEFDYNGKILWKAPNDGQVSGEATEYYHHEITKLSNGHYMIAGYEKLARPIPADPSVFYGSEDSTFRKAPNGGYEKLIVSGTLIEYDAKGKVVWHWKAIDHFKESDLFRPKKALLAPYSGNTYLNGFDFDEAGKAIYISFRDINRVLKIAYPSGKVLNAWGETVNADLSIEPNSPFYGQHCVRLDRKTKNLLLFNNNVPNTAGAVTDNVSHVCIYKQPASPQGKLETIWDFSCKRLSESMPASPRFGSVCLLENDCLLACVGLSGRAFIVNRNQEVLWDAVPYATEMQPDGMAKRVMMPVYRVNYVRENDIERFIFR